MIKQIIYIHTVYIIGILLAHCLLRIFKIPFYESNGIGGRERFNVYGPVGLVCLYIYLYVHIIKLIKIFSYFNHLISIFYILESDF